MEVHHLLHTYSTKVNQIYMLLQDAASEALKGLVKKITELFNKVTKSLRFQALTSLAFAGATGGCMLLNAKIPGEAPIKPFVEMGGKVLPELGRFANTWQQGDYKKADMEQQLYQTHHLQKEQEIKKKFDETNDKQRDTISRLGDIDAQGYRTLRG